MQSQITTVASAPPSSSHAALTAHPIFDRIWPPAIIAFGLGLTGTWICLLGYGLIIILSEICE